MATKVIMPQLGESVVEGTVTRWLKKEGERIEEFEALLEVNTDKVDTEIPSPASGILLKILIEENTTVQAGVTLCWIGNPGDKLEEEVGYLSHSHEGVAETVPTPVQQPAPVPAAGPARDLGFISPVVAKIAGEHNVDLQKVTGTGMGGRITKKDVLAYLDAQKTAPPVSASPWDSQPDSGGDLFRPTEEIFKRASEATAAAQAAARPQPASEPPTRAAAPQPTPGSGLQSELVPLNTMRRKIAEHMVRSKTVAPHVTTVMEVDLSRIVAHRSANKDAFARSGVNLTFTAYFVSAVVQAIKAHPMVNSSWSDDGILVHKQINIGMATALDDGLIVPVLKNADELSLLGIARSVNDMAARARVGQLRPDEVTHGTFTITNHGIFGSLFATPVINQPQCGILGVGAIQKRVVVINEGSGDSIAIRPMVYLSLTFDHRILDGASGDRFLAGIVQNMQNFS